MTNDELGEKLALERYPHVKEAILNIAHSHDRYVFTEGFKAAQQADSERVKELEGALEEAIEGMETMVDDLENCYIHKCVPSAGECASAKAYLIGARKDLSADRECAK